ncbi:MAG: c-type cytochrome [Rhodocyclales bacterium]|nr:c-type cytochrome [Rhodocyclales bacterium]
MKSKLIILVLGGLFAGPVFAATEAEAMDLAKKNGCLACHTLDKKMVGPAWKDVGRKYANDSAAAEHLAVKVKKGSKGVWGQIPMPPNATVKDVDVKTLVDYVLSLK